MSGMLAKVCMWEDMRGKSNRKKGVIYEHADCHGNADTGFISVGPSCGRLYVPIKERSTLILPLLQETGCQG